MTPPGGKGFLLVASPELRDPNFVRTVVLMVQHDREGAFGLVLNRPTTHHLSEVLDDLDPRWADVTLHQGGPVQTNLLQFVLRSEAPGTPVVPGLSVGATVDDLEEAGVGAGDVRAVVGYSGWGAQQLERETEEGSWIVLPAAPRHVFEIPPERLWATVLRESGGSHAWMSLSDGDPSDN